MVLFSTSDVWVIATILRLHVISSGYSQANGGENGRSRDYESLRLSSIISFLGIYDAGLISANCGSMHQVRVSQRLIDHMLFVMKESSCSRSARNYHTVSQRLSSFGKGITLDFDHDQPEKGKTANQRCPCSIARTLPFYTINILILENITEIIGARKISVWALFSNQ
jgi:hypothetical protein